MTNKSRESGERVTDGFRRRASRIDPLVALRHE
jgi:hypothetical protein